MRDYQRLYKKCLKSRRNLKNRCHAILEELYETRGSLGEMKAHFTTRLTDEVNHYVNNYEGWLQKKANKWKSYYEQANHRLQEKEAEIERLRNGEKI